MKIIEELSVASSERMEDLEMKIERLEEENTTLRDKLRKLEPTGGSERQSGGGDGA